MAERLAPALWLLAVGSGCALSFAAIPELLLYGDELHSLPVIERPPSDLMRHFGVNGSGSALLLVQHLGLALFGPTLWAVRLPAALGCVAALALVYPAGRRWVGAEPAALAALALATNPMHVFYSRFGRSYALAVFLALALGTALWRATRDDEPQRGPYLATAVCAALLPWAHLSSAGFVVGVGAAAVLALGLAGRLRRHGPWFAASCAGAGLGCAALYLPALAPLAAFVGQKTGSPGLPLASLPDLFTLLAGGPWLGLVWMLGVPAAGVWLLARRGADAIVPVAAAFAMGPALAMARPVGNEWAYARYLLPGLPFALLLLAWAFWEAARALRLPPPAAFATGVLLVAGAFTAGPYGPGRSDDGRFAASYLTLSPLPAFDAPWTGAPGFYAQLARDPAPARVLEVPELWDQGAALYRNYYLQHRKDVGMGFVARELPAGLGGPIAQPLVAEPEGFDYLVLHRDVAKEIQRYWRFVYEHAWPAHRDPEREPFMRSMAALAVSPPPSQPELEARWRRRYGDPVYEDGDIIVWSARPPPPSG